MDKKTLEAIVKWLIRNWKYGIYAAQVLQYLLKLRKQKPMKPEFKEFREMLVAFIVDKTDGNMFHKFIYEKVFNFLVGILEEKASPEIIKIVESFVVSIVTQEDEILIEYLTDIINKKIDIPGLNEETEGEVIESILITIAVSIRGFISNRQSLEQDNSESIK